MLSVIVKAFNEEDNIARCIESILRETEGIEREIIVVDSLSTDRTVEIAKNYPVKIVQFINQEDCGCGAAPQLGYQVSKGSLIYLIDGDMEMISGFLRSAMSYMSDNSSVAGVGGVLVDINASTVISKRRSGNYQKINEIINVNSLGGGGLYRRSALATVGYFSHRGLKALEELELGLRLTAIGWHLVRLPTPSVLHSGHDESYFHSIIRLWKSGRLAAHGVLLRSSWRKKWFLKALILNWFVVAPFLLTLMVPITYVFFNFFLSMSIGIVESTILVFLFVLMGVGVKKKSLKLSLLSVSSWFVVAVASVRGIFHLTQDPNQPIIYRTI